MGENVSHSYFAREVTMAAIINWTIEAQEGIGDGLALNVIAKKTKDENRCLRLFCACFGQSWDFIATSEGFECGSVFSLI
jgi:hypothetical protein